MQREDIATAAGKRRFTTESLRVIKAFARFGRARALFAASCRNDEHFA